MGLLNRRWLAVLLGCWLRLGATAQAQSTAADGPRYYSVRTTDPADGDFADLAALGREIGAARVVLLGEPSHGEGNVFEAKIRLLRYLQQQGFTTVAFESGFYELARAPPRPRQVLAALPGRPQRPGPRLRPQRPGGQDQHRF